MGLKRWLPWLPAPKFGTGLVPTSFQTTNRVLYLYAPSVPSFLGHYWDQNWAGTILWTQRKTEPEKELFFTGEGRRSVSARAGAGLFLGFSLSPCAGSGGGAVGQELARSLGRLPMGRLPIIRARITLAC